MFHNTPQNKLTIHRGTPPGPSPNNSNLLLPPNPPLTYLEKASKAHLHPDPIITPNAPTTAFLDIAIYAYKYCTKWHMIPPTKPKTRSTDCVPAWYPEPWKLWWQNQKTAKATPGPLYGFHFMTELTKSHQSTSTQLHPGSKDTVKESECLPWDSGRALLDKASFRKWWKDGTPPKGQAP